MVQETSFADLIGIPFIKGGRPTEGSKGLDCYGLIMLVHSRLGNDIGDFTSPDFHAEVAEIMEREKKTWDVVWQKTDTDKELPISDIEIGDTLLIRIKGYNCHVGIVHKKSWFLHTWEDTNGVTAERLSLWSKRIVGVYRYNNGKS